MPYFDVDLACMSYIISSAYNVTRKVTMSEGGRDGMARNAEERTRLETVLSWDFVRRRRVGSHVIGVRRYQA